MLRILKWLSNKAVSCNKLIVLTAVFWMAFANFSFFAALTQVYPLEGKNIFFLISIALGFTGVIILVLSLLCWRYTIKPVLILLLISSASVAYFMDTYNVIIDDAMIVNVLSTDVKEASDLMSFKFALYVALLGVLPAWFVYSAKISFQPIRREVFGRSKLFFGTLIVMVILYFGSSANISSFFREHKAVRYYSNPANFFVASIRHVRNIYRGDTKAVTPLGLDAHTPKFDTHRELIIMVVGETARADRFSLNGYKKETNPKLKQRNVISFSDFRSCGTSTAYSVPCMFSPLGEENYDQSTAHRQEDALDVLKHAGVSVLWRDNNSSSKGVADRVEYQDYRTPQLNTICDEECRDEGMLVGLQEYINSKEKGDIMIVLHQMGNHGPAYYKRYPKEFEKFTPVCKTNELSDCSQEELDNAYDNAVLYTDHFLAKTIDLLKQNDDKFETAMFYVSDHGESLGEYGLYLHGMPNMIAPETQRHVPAIMWIGKNYDEVDVEALRAKKDKHFSHDNIFHTLLGFMEIESKVYKPELDILK